MKFGIRLARKNLIFIAEFRDYRVSAETLPAKGNERLKPSIAVIQPIGLPHAHAEPRPMKQVYVEHQFSARRPVELVILLTVVVERIAGNPLDVEQLTDRKIGI